MVASYLKPQIKFFAWLIICENENRECHNKIPQQIYRQENYQGWTFTPARRFKWHLAAFYWFRTNFQFGTIGKTVSKTKLFHVSIFIPPIKHFQSYFYFLYRDINQHSLNSFVFDSLFTSNYTLQVKFCWF